MKHFLLIFQISTAFVLVCIFFACSSTIENTKEDNYFEPVKRNPAKKFVSSQSGFNEEYSRVGIPDSTSGEIVLMFRRQNEQLSDIVQQLRMLAKKESAESLSSTDDLNNLLSTRERISNEILVEMIREQNERLNDVVGQLKLLTQNQQSGQSRHSVETSSEPSTESFLSSSHKYAVSYGYGQAIQLYQQKNYKKAIKAFQSLLDAGMDAALQDNCHFWKGVSCFHLNRIHQAMAEFAHVLALAESDKMEGAYFMIGQCYEKRGEKKMAKKMFEKMLTIYPHGKLKQVGEIKLALLK